LRQDSGDPFEFINVAINLYRELGIDPATKNIVFGTFFTNDFAKKAEPEGGHLDGEGPLPPKDAEKSKPLNM
jgi:nicotinic acid phosphoribosyltransferase